MNLSNLFFIFLSKEQATPAVTHIEAGLSEIREQSKPENVLRVKAPPVVKPVVVNTAEGMYTVGLLFTHDLYLIITGLLLDLCLHL